MSTTKSITSNQWTREWPLALAIITFLLALGTKESIGALLDNPVVLVVWLLILCAVILVAAIAIVRHADVLAHRLGQCFRYFK